MKQIIIFFIAFSLIWVTIDFHQIKADASVDDGDDVALKIQIEQLYSKISLFESNVEEKVRELRTKDENINQMENIIREKSDTILSLQNEMQAVQGKGAVDDKEQVDEAQARISELETQVANLRKETEKLSQKRNSLESRASTAEKKVSELNLKMESLKRISDEQKTRIRKTERALQVAKEETRRAKSQETKIFKELKKVQESWVPHWLSIHLFHCQSFISSQWKESGRPMLDATLQKALQKKAEVNKWAEPHIETLKTKWVPVMKDQSTRLVSQIEPGVKLLATKTSEVYHASRKFIGPHLVQLQETLDPYVQEVKKFTKPYVDQAVTVAKPYVDNACVFLKPYTKKISRSYRKFLKAFTRYHLQLQAIMREIMMSSEFGKPLATENMVWLSASSLMAAPIIFLFKLLSVIFGKKPRRRTRSSHAYKKTRRKAK